MKLSWSPRARPIEPCALLAPRSIVPRLHAHLVTLPEEERRELRGVSAPSCWILVGAADALPWIPGVLYLGREPEARAIFAPTHSTLTPSAALLERALRNKTLPAPWAVYGDPIEVVSLAEARPIDLQRMAERA